MRTLHKRSVPPLFAIDYYSPFTVLLGLPALFLIVMTDWMIDGYVRFSKRERILNFESNEWDQIIETIEARFPSVIEKL